MRFIQYVFPDGRQREESIDRPEEIERMAKDLCDAGYRFEIECFPDTQLINMDCCDSDSALAVCNCRNGPAVPTTVDKLVKAAYEAWGHCGFAKANERTA